MWARRKDFPIGEWEKLLNIIHRLLFYADDEDKNGEDVIINIVNDPIVGETDTETRLSF